MSEFRQDRTRGAWVIIAPERGRRPHEWHSGDAAASPVPPFDPACPFCPGNERQLPGIIGETPADTPPGWRVRVVPNKYPALRPEAPPAPSAGRAAPGFGHHEVIIETGRHDAALATLADADLDAVVRAYRHRYTALMTQPGVKAVLVFRNHGGRAGASLLHPHSQVMAIGMTPPRLAEAAAWARAQFASEGRCVTCDEIARELADGKRIVEATDHFVALVPYAAANPFEQVILPRRHHAAFAETDDAALAELGRLLRRSLHRLRTALDDPPYNFVIESVEADPADAPFLHWGLRIVPILVRPGGFELGSGLPINPSLPEDDAAALRAAADTPRAETP